MSKNRDLVDWHTKIDGVDLAENFIKYAHLDSIDAEIIRARRDNIYQYEVAEKCHITVDTVKNRTRKLITKYIDTYKKYPDKLVNFSLRKKRKRRNIGYYVDYAVINMVPFDQSEKTHSLIIQDELFEDFLSIREEVIRRIEIKTGEKLESFKNYTMCINGSYEHIDL